MKECLFYRFKSILLKKGTLVSLFTTLFLLLSISINAQSSNSVTGVVRDGNNEPLIGVSVVVKGTTTGTHTDIDGKFTINASTNATLEVSYVGFIKQTIVVGNKKHFEIVLQEDLQMLGEVVVVGYGTLDKKQVTSSITSISEKDLMQGTGSASVANALQGKIGGLLSLVMEALTRIIHSN